MDTRDAQGRTALHVAASSDRTAMVNFLLEQGAEINSVDKAGMTPLHLAAQKGMVAAARELVQQGASLTARTQAEVTAFSKRPRSSGLDLSAFEDVLRKPDVRIPKGATPLAVAEICKQTDVATLLRQHGGKR